MKIIETSYSMSVTKQIKEYEPMNVHFSLKAEVDENNWKEAFIEIRRKVREVIKGEEELLKKYAQMQRSSGRPTASQVREYSESEQEFINNLK